jgi:hypothetical protein
VRCSTAVSLEDIKEQFEDEFAPQKITYQDLQQFVSACCTAAAW